MNTTTTLADVTENLESISGVLNSISGALYAFMRGIRLLPSQQDQLTVIAYALDGAINDIEMVLDGSK